jgi:ATP-dependent exoDNAse (exonuclease V) alpha subunit
MTIHKSQGSTMEKVTVFLKKGMERSLIYVAFSRATTLNGLFLIGEFKPPSPPGPNHLPTKEMRRPRC